MAMFRTSFSSKLFIEGLRKAAFDAYNALPLTYTEIYQVNKSTHQKEYDHSIASIGMLAKKGEGDPVTYEDFVDGYDTIYQHNTYAKAIRCTEELIEDMMYGVMTKRAKALGKSARYRKEWDHASLFNDADSATVISGFTPPNSEALCANSHALAGITGVTIDNLTTSDLSLSELETAFLYFRNVVRDDQNLRISMTPKTLLIPPALEFDAHEILNSTLKPYTANNETNYFKGALNIVVWPFLTGSDDWFVLAGKDDGAPQSFDRVPVSFKEEGDFDTGDLKIKCRTRYSFGYSDWRWCYGSSD